METIELNLTIAQLRVIQNVLDYHYAEVQQRAAEQETDPDELLELLDNAG